jgi:hypothetical protein
MEEQEIKDDPILAVVTGQLRKSKAELVSDIEGHLSALLGMDVKQAFEKVASTQQIRGGAMNIDRTHKSALVLIAHALSLITNQNQN